MRGTDYEFISADAEALVTKLVNRYEELTGRTLQPADPDRVFLAWIADAISSLRTELNYIGNQNIPSRAVGENLDALGQWLLNLPRNPAQPAKTTMRFTISAAQSTSIIIPSGTRVTDLSQTLVWETTSDTLIAAGDTTVDVMVQCQTAGLVGNGYAAGQINTLIDVDNVLYYTSCVNLTESDGGADEETDEEYYERMRLSMDAKTTAGAASSYEYWAKSVSNEIGDVKVVRPSVSPFVEGIPIYEGSSGKYAFLGGDQIDASSVKIYEHGIATPAVEDTDYTLTYENGLLTIELIDTGDLYNVSSLDADVVKTYGGMVEIYAIMKDGTPATTVIKDAIYDACNSEDVRPLTDMVSVKDPDTYIYDVGITYYVQTDSPVPLTELHARVQKAVEEYTEWQSAKIGRDINPAKLWQLLMETGIKRAVITAPTFQKLSSESVFDQALRSPEIASLGTVTITNGGYEDE